MNKLYLIAGGACMASLAAGGTAGYFLAKRKFEARVDDLIDEEVAKTKKYYAVLLMEARSGKPESINNVITYDEKIEEDDEDDPQELTEEDRKVILKGRETLAKASKILTDYQGYAKKPELSDIVTNNIFNKDKKPLPPRGPGGKFTKNGHDSSQEKNPEETPYLISQEDFLLNDGEFEQRNLLYFKDDDTLIDLENNNDVVDNGVIGEVNLTLFPPEEDSLICVRNEGLQTDYEIRLMTESLTEFMGLGTEQGFDEDHLASANRDREE